MTDFTLTLAGPRGDSSADLARRLGLVASTASDTEALMAILNRTVSAAAASTGNVSLSSAPATLDGVTLANGDRVLLHAQTAPAENGIYVFTSAGAALTRWSGADEWHELPGLTVGVAGGSTHANTAWTCFSAQGGTLGTTAVTFLKLAGSLNALLSLANTWSALNTFSAGINLTGGNLGIGTASPSYKLTIGGAPLNGDPAFYIGNPGTGQYFRQGIWYGAASNAFLDANGPLLLNPAGAGNVGIGATSAAYKLTIGGAPINGDPAFYIGNAGTGQYFRQGIWWAGASNAFLDANGALLLNPAGGGPVSAGANVLPTTDNTLTLGGASFRWSTVYAGTGTINTSDATEKSDFEPIPPGVAAAGRALMGRIGVYQWLTAVAEKGPDKARLHIGLKAQDVRDAFLDEGEDPTRWGLFCEDPILEPVTRTRMVERPVLEPRTRAQEIIVVEDGVAVQRIVEERAEEPVFDLVPVVDEAGQPVLRQVTATDEKGEPVILQEPLLHAVAVTETVEETYEVMEPTGETRLGLRHEQLLMLFLAVLAERG